MGRDLIQQLFGALLVGAVLGLIKFFRDLDRLRTTIKYELDAVKAEYKPVVEWYFKTSMDGLRIATNPTSERLAELADRYIANVRGDQGKTPLSTQEKQELIDGLYEVMRNPKEFASKRQSASMSLRFIETREGLTARNH